MSYRKKTKKGYGFSQHRRNPLPSQKPFMNETTEKETIKLFGKLPLTTKERERKQEISEVPEAIVRRDRATSGVKVGNRIVNAGIYGDKENEEKMKFPRGKSRDKNVKIV